MDDGLLLQSVEGLWNSPFTEAGGEMWNWLQNLREEVSQELLRGGTLCRHEAGGLRENETSASSGSKIEWIRRGQLEARLCAITYAQDRLLDGNYGKCVDCGEQINPGHLAADPAVSLCLDCQRFADGESR
jgi:RNA polymerase-binding transcription factor DksA